ncbi:hypothetical protein [Nonomuraea sp. NPDC049709]|uniref:hypothetical protein n=1 Tax=Nonomuraea sp. NPDC049709 TaxID=3154736 RepID=UPI00342AD8FE
MLADDQHAAEDLLRTALTKPGRLGERAAYGGADHGRVLREEKNVAFARWGAAAADRFRGRIVGATCQTLSA